MDIEKLYVQDDNQDDEYSLVEAGFTSIKVKGTWKFSPIISCASCQRGEQHLMNLLISKIECDIEFYYQGFKLIIWLSEDYI